MIDSSPHEKNTPWLASGFRFSQQEMENHLGPGAGWKLRM